MSNTQLLLDCLQFIQNDVDVLQGQHKAYIDLEQRLVDAIAGDNSKNAPRILRREETIDSRDVMAASLVLPEDLSRQTGRVLAGPEPYDGLELIKWWARAKARLRYIEVDAMLEERDK